MIVRARSGTPSRNFAPSICPDTFRYDLMVSMPKMKTHHWVGVTLSMKNFFGFVPGAVNGWPKNILHWAGINECIVDLYTEFPYIWRLWTASTGNGGQRPDSGHEETSRRAGGGDRSGGHGCDLLPDHAHRPAENSICALLKIAGRRPPTTSSRLGSALKQYRTTFSLITSGSGFGCGYESTEGIPRSTEKRTEPRIRACISKRLLAAGLCALNLLIACLYLRHLLTAVWISPNFISPPNLSTLMKYQSYTIGTPTSHS